MLSPTASNVPTRNDTHPAASNVPRQMRPQAAGGQSASTV